MNTPFFSRLRTVTRPCATWLIAPICLGLQACALSAPAATPQSGALWGTQWQLQALGGQPVIDQSRATLQFPEQGQAAGNGSCNSFGGKVTVSANRITFGGLASTKKACPGDAMAQERDYLAALQSAQRFEQQGDTLLIYVQGMAQPLRFIRAQ